MATARNAAVALAGIVTLATVPGNRKLKPSAVSIDNQGVVGHTIHLRDDFTPAVSNAVPAPVAQTIEKFQATVPAGNSILFEGDQVKNLEFLGTLKMYADAADALCIVIVHYSLE